MDKITILEYCNEYGEYVFYRAYKNITPNQAIKRYVEDENIETDDEVINNIEGDEMEGIARAYQVELEN